MEQVYGIDLGTTRSSIAHFDRYGKVEIIKNADNEEYTPSVVYFPENSAPIVGKAARSFQGGRPDRTVAFIKRHMDENNYAATIGTGGERKTPTEITTLILQKIVSDANSVLKSIGKEVKDVVITVPANFTDTARQRTKKAAENVGLNVLALINEPTAAILYYIEEQSAYSRPTNKTYLVYDLGGGTCDVTVVRSRNLNVNVLASCGSNPNHIGGIDWDRALVRMALDAAHIAEDMVKFEKTPEGSSMLVTAEQLKETLSNSAAQTVSFNVLHPTLPPTQLHTQELSRSDFERATYGLLRNTGNIIDEALKAAETNCNEKLHIDEVILIGGATSMPQVAKLMEDKFKGITITRPHNANYAVAMGAALEARNIKNGKKANSAGDAGNIAVRASEVCSRSYALRALYKGETMLYNLIFKNDKIPCTKTWDVDFRTQIVSDSVKMAVYQTAAVNTTDLRVPLSRGTIVQEATLHFGENVPADTPLKVSLFCDSNGLLRIKGSYKDKQVEFKINTN
jgi:molecular chaperone DnaK (HSP70)